jgi:hypothetical protein
VAWAAVALTGLAYVATMARGIGFYDSGELALASVELGLGHPPGQPLYTLLSALFAHLPGVSPLLGLNFFSALCGALTVLPVLSLTERTLPEGAREQRAAALCCAAGVVLVSQHAALWEQSTRIEVYALAALLALWSLARLAHVLDEGASPDGWIALGGVVGGCAAVNPVMAAFAALIALPAIGARLRRRELSWGAFGWLTAGALLGLIPYVYVPFIADRSDRFVWGAPTRGAALVDYLLVRDFRVNLGVPIARWGEQVVAWLGFASDSGLLPVWALGLTGHAVAAPTSLGRAAVPVAALTALLYLSSYALFQPDLPDCVSYASIATWLCAGGAGALIALLWLRGLRAGALLLGVAIAAAAVIAPPFALSRTRHLGDPARELSSGLLASLPPRTLLVVSADHWAAPLWYLQEVEKARPDVVIIATGLLSSSWYFEHMYRRHPDLRRIPLQTPGGRRARLMMLLAAQPDRPLAFENESDAEALGLQTCVGPVFAHARIACSHLPAQRTAFTQRVAHITRRSDAGELTVTGVLADVSLSRARLLARHGHMQEALAALFAGVDPVMSELDPRLAERVAMLSPRPLAEPAWQRDTALGDPARNLYMAAQLAGAAGDGQNAAVLLMLASELGLPEAAQLIEQLKRTPTAHN